MFKIHKLLHHFKKKKCLENAVWENGHLICPTCNNVIAYRYRIDDDVFIYIYQNYRKYIKEVYGRKNEDIKCSRDLVYDIDYSEFKELKNELIGMADRIMTEPIRTEGEESFEEELNILL